MYTYGFHGTKVYVVKLGDMKAGGLIHVDLDRHLHIMVGLGSFSGRYAQGGRRISLRFCGTASNSLAV
jgi:hypothetical protein